jgi:hypothetical protein
MNAACDLSTAGVPRIVSVHVPKCAGTSFRHVLETIYGPRLWPNYGRVFVREQAQPGCVPEDAVVIHGHFMADAFDEVLPRRRLITWVRHPVERVVSNYYHFLRSPDMRDDCCRVLHEKGLTLTQFAELDWMRNEATRYLARKPLEEFAAVGIAERFADSLEIMAHALHWPSVPVAPRANVNPSRQADHYELSDEERGYFGYLNSADLAWYGEAVVVLEDTLADLATRVA